MFEITLLIPESDNAGEKFGPETFAQWEALLADRFGGFSLLPGTTHGGWRGPDGTMYRDRLRGYAVWAVGLACGGRPSRQPARRARSSRKRPSRCDSSALRRSFPRRCEGDRVGREGASTRVPP